MYVYFCKLFVYSEITFNSLAPALLPVCILVSLNVIGYVL